MSTFIASNLIPLPSDEQLQELQNKIHDAVYSDPCVTYESMMLKGYRVVTPLERYYYEEQMKLDDRIICSPHDDFVRKFHLLKSSLWILEGLFHCNYFIFIYYTCIILDQQKYDNYKNDDHQRRMDFLAQRGRLRLQDRQSANDGDDDNHNHNRAVYLNRKRAFENDSDSNDYEIPTEIESKVDSKADTVGTFNHNYWRS